MMRDLDPGLVMYMLGAITVVLMGFVVMDAFTSSIQAIHQRSVEEDKRKKKALRERSIIQSQSEVISKDISE